MLNSLQPLSRPNLDYQYVFDLCAIHTYSNGPVAVIANCDFYAYEMSRRLPDAVIYRTGRGISALEKPEPLSMLAPRNIVWVEPDVADADKWIEQIYAALPDDGILACVLSGRLAHRLFEWRSGIIEGNPVNWRRMQTLLHPFTIRQRYTFHGPVSIVCGVISNFMERRGHLDLADQWLYRMRAAFASQVWEHPLSTMNVIVVQRS
jgi:hypothetical protein